MEEIDRRIELSRERFGTLRNTLTKASHLVDGKACVYATGSFGRQEASRKSDLDLFIVSLGIPDEQSPGKFRPALSNIDEIILKSELIKASQDLEFPPFDGDGRYLNHNCINELVNSIGTEFDDYKNYFTARLLLILESQPLLNSDVYDAAVDSAIQPYWRDFEDHEENFSPGFLINDILRLWRTFCVNYEARTKQVPEDKRIKRKVKNYKLKYSRLMTCFSGIIYLLYIFGKRSTVSKQDVVEMVHKTPVQRLRYVSDQSIMHSVSKNIGVLIEQYNTFLSETSEGDQRLIEMFSDRSIASRYASMATEFGSCMKRAIDEVGQDTRLHRMVTV